MAYKSSATCLKVDGVHRSVLSLGRARAMASAALWAFMLVAAFALLFISRSVGGGSDKNGELLLLVRRYSGVIDKLEKENAVLRAASPASRKMLEENKALKSSVAALEVKLADLQERRDAPAPAAKVASEVASEAAAPAAATAPSRALAATAPFDKDTTFTEERAKRVATNNQILLTFVNRIRLDFATTWVHHVRRLGMTNWLVGATDKTSLLALLGEKTPTFDMRTDLPEGEWPWGSASFKSLGPHKIELIYKCIKWGLDMIITDVDALVLREPFAFMARWPDAGFLTTSDQLGNTTHDDGLETHRGIHSAFNIGYMLFRKSALPLVEEWRTVIRADPSNKWDQGEFNRIARLKWDVGRTSGLSDERLFWAYKSQVIGGVLPLSLFAGGHNHFVSQYARRLGWQPYSIHTTFQYGAAAGKRHRLREATVWHDPPAYYDPPGGLLTFNPQVPEKLIHPSGGMDVVGHIKLINYQLRQIRTALAIATALGRKLILPSVICGYDKAWYQLGSHGEFGGAPPFVVPIFDCPLDHYLEPGMLDPVRNIREYSFLSNPRTPQEVKQGVKSVEIDNNGGKAEMARLARLSSFKVLNVTNIPSGFGLPGPGLAGLQGLLTRKEASAIESKYRHAGGSWCCAPKGKEPRAAGFSLWRAV